MSNGHWDAKRAEFQGYMRASMEHVKMELKEVKSGQNKNRDDIKELGGRVSANEKDIKENKKFIAKIVSGITIVGVAGFEGIKQWFGSFK